MQINLPSNIGHSFDVSKFSADISSSPAIIDDDKGTKNLEFLGSIKLPKVIPIFYCWDGCALQALLSLDLNCDDTVLSLPSKENPAHLQEIY